MFFMLDENVSAGVADTLRGFGHRAEFIREHVPLSTPDLVVAAVSEERDAVLISMDGDSKSIAPRIPHGNRQRFRKLSRIWLRCTAYQSSQRLQKAMSFVEAEYHLSKNQPDSRMFLEIGNSYIKSNR